MNKSLLLFLISLYGAASVGYADEVIGRAPNNTAGHFIGGWTGVMTGGVVAGPVGAILGGLGIAWLGGQLQETSGLSEQAYQVSNEHGDVQVVRSPNRQWQIGDQVAVVANRLQPAAKQD